VLHYPLPGVFAIARLVANGLQFTNDYTIEMAMLTQLYRLVGPEAMAQVSLDVFYHIGQPYPALTEMAVQIAGYVIRELLEAGVNPDTIIQDFKQAGERRIQKDVQVAKDLAKRVQDVKLNHTPEDDRKHLADYLGILKRLLAEGQPQLRTQVFPSWTAINQATGNYVQISRMLRRRAVQSTWTRLVEAGYV